MKSFFSSATKKNYLQVGYNIHTIVYICCNMQI